MARTVFTIGGPQVLIPESDTPTRETSAEASTQLDSRQRAIAIGEPVPIVFGKRVERTTYKWNGDVATAIVYDVGGVFVSPGATEGRFSNNATTNELSVKFHLVLSEGDMPQLQLRDVFQRACRVGTWTQTYNRRAATWTPGNFITAVAGKQLWDCPIFCGTSGYYDDLTTLSYENIHADGDDTWDRQVHCFVREGIIVDRLIEGTAGSSNNVCDLAIYLIKQSSRFPDALIDTATFTIAANFTETQQLYYNGEFRDSQNLEDWLQSISTYFLLRVSDSNGKKAFKPRLPITEAYAINTGVIASEFGFTEDHLLPDGFEIEWIPFADRRPTIMQMLWRQQPEDDIGLVRTSLVNIVNEFDDLPVEQHDLSGFCGSELHAVKVGAYLAARRAFVTHTLRIRVKPDAYNTTLALGDIVRVRLQRETDLDSLTYHDYLYEVERINKTFSGAVELDLIHFPIDSNGRSVVALYVAAAQIKGYEYPTGRSVFTCDTPGRDGNNDPLPDDGGDLPDLPNPDEGSNPVDPNGDPTDPAWPDGSPTWPSDTPDPNEPNAPTVPKPEWPAGTADPDDPNNQSGRDSNVGGGGASGTGGINNPADPIDSATNTDVGGGGTIGNIPSGRPLLPGDTVTSPTYLCPGYKTEWWICPPAYVANNVGVLEENLAQACELVDEGSDYLVTAAAAGKHIVAIGRCPDPSAPDGFGAATGATATDQIGGENSIFFAPRGAGTWRVRWTLGFGTNYDISTTEAPNGIGVYMGDDDNYCGLPAPGGNFAARQWTTYVNASGDLVRTVTNSGCVVVAPGQIPYTEVYFTPTGGTQVKLYP